MLRPEEMTRTVIVGSMDGLDATVECLYDLGVLHLIDFTKPDEEFKIGPPLPAASKASQKLLKLRSMIRSLELESHKPERKLSTDEVHAKLEQALVTLDLNTTSKVESRQKIVSLIREKEAEIRALQPFESFGISVEDLDGYENVSVFAGTCKKDPTEVVKTRLTDFEIFVAPMKGAVSVLLFVKNDEKGEASRALSDVGYQEIKVPKLSGPPSKIIANNTREIAELEDDLARIEDDIDGIRKRFADFIVASEEDLAITVLKAETPLRFAASANSFVIDGWVPKSKLGPLRTALDGTCAGRTYLEVVEPEKDEEPPVKLKNPRPVKPFEFFISLVSTPKYEEADPTLILFITFPIFFGFMLGDLGFGAALLLIAGIVYAKFKDSPDLRRLMIIVMVGGAVASVFGMFVYCEAFGVPFHPPETHPDEMSWASVVNIPLHPLLEKLSDTKELLALSILAGWIHLTVGLLLGFRNHLHESPKEAMAKIAWILVLLGLFIEIMTIAGGASKTSEFLNQNVLSVFPQTVFTVIGIKVSVSAVAFIIIGIVALPFTEGPIALSEILSIFANLISYARLAALAVGKGAMAFAFNSMLLPMVFGGNILIAIAAFLTLFVTQMFFVFFLGSLSVGIQAIRLNYVEFFLKFFEGGGTDFSPLKYFRRFTTATK